MTRIPSLGAGRGSEVDVSTYIGSIPTECGVPSISK